MSLNVEVQGLLRGVRTKKLYVSGSAFLSSSVTVNSLFVLNTAGVVLGATGSSVACLINSGGGLEVRNHATGGATSIFASNIAVSSGGETAYTFTGNGGGTRFGMNGGASWSNNTRGDVGTTTTKLQQIGSGSLKISGSDYAVLNFAGSTVALLPGAGIGQTGSITYVSNGDGGNPCFAIYTGTTWKRLLTGSAVNATPGA